MLLATSLNVFWDKEMSVSLEEGLRRCAEAGFEGVDFNFVDYDRSMLERMVGRLDSDAYARSLRKRAEELGLRFVQAHGPIFDKFGDPQVVQPLVEMSHESLRWAAAVGAPWIVFEPETASGAFDEAHYEENMQRNLAFFRDLLRTAEEVGIGIAIENVSDALARPGARRRYYSVPTELIDLVDRLNHPLIGICWDVGHAHLQRLDQRQALRALGKRLVATHIQDNDGVKDWHMLPYCGDVDWRSVVAGLRDIGYTGAFCYETHRSIRFVPDHLRDDLLRYAVRLGKHLLSLA
ncbi:MAG: sugar phosphate isomerase/epimerase [Chloroflexi bacterium]|jgi:L-ribulose-5-phosphate 3-epimerase|nr:sugar phosphate isomerase/epimerase [Chloroflexota bacterium]